MKKHIKLTQYTFLFLICFLFSFQVTAQVSIKGTVLDDAGNELPGVIISLKQGKELVEYGYTDKTGNFHLKTNRYGDFKLIFRFLGYKTKIKPIKIKKEKNIQFKIQLYNDAEQLHEVVIKSEPPISVKGDSITFIADYFTDGTEETVEDLLKKIPGLNVTADGAIKVGNKEVEKIMVGGDDFFGHGYKILSKNMPAYPIAKVQVLKHYNENELLKEIKGSHKVALNLELEKKYKHIWFGNLKAGIGTNKFYKAKMNLMNFGDDIKYYFLTGLNNVGYDMTGELRALFKSSSPSISKRIHTNGVINNLSGYNGLGFRTNRTNLNNSKLVSLNAIIHPVKKLEIKPLLLFNWDKTYFNRHTTSVVKANGVNFVNDEQYKLTNNKHVIIGKLRINYDISKTQTLVSETKIINGNFTDVSNFVFNENKTLGILKHDQLTIDQYLVYTTILDNQKAVILSGRFINENRPENYHINRFFYQGLFPSDSSVNNVGQKVQNHMQYLGFNAHFMKDYKNDNNLELELGYKHRVDKLKSVFLLMNDENILTKPKNFQNNTNYKKDDLYFKGSYKFQFGTFQLNAIVALHQLFNKLKYSKTYKKQNPFFINPKIELRWEPNDKNMLSISYGFNSTNSGLLDMYSGYILTGYRSFRKGTGDFNKLNASHLFVAYTFGNWTDRFFANLTTYYTKNHDFISTNSSVQSNYVKSEGIIVKNRFLLGINGDLNYYFDALSSNLKIQLGYNQSEYKNVVNGSNLRVIKSENYTYGLTFKTAFSGVFNFHIGAKWETSKMLEPLQDTYTSIQGFLFLNFYISDNFTINMKNSMYHFGNLLKNKNYYFSDIQANYMLIENKLTIGIVGKNLFNTHIFKKYSFNDLGSSITKFNLLPRMIMIEAEFRF